MQDYIRECGLESPAKDERLLYEDSCTQVS